MSSTPPKLTDFRRIVVKVGSSLLVDAQAGRARAAWRDVLVVSSGAIALGRSVLRLPRGPLKLEDSQAAAAVGQIALARIWAEVLGRHGITAGQVLVTPGDTEQRRRYLTPVLRGEAIAAFALSEPDAGSDVSAMSTTARRDGGDYVLNGVKTWISNGGIADHYVVFARTGEQPGAKGLSAFVVEPHLAGFEVTERLRVIGPHPIATLRFSDMRVPASAMIGGPGEGFAVAMQTLDVFRTTVGAAALGFSRRALDESLARVQQRVVFGKKLGAFQLTQAKIADMAVGVDAIALLVYRAAWTRDTAKRRITREASMAKLFGTETAQQIIDMAVQLHGGIGVVADQAVENLYREIRPLRIYEGTSEIQKLVIANEVLKAAGGAVT